MNTEESIKQIKTLIEAWKLDEADLNQTDINAMQVLLKENQELREALEIKSYCKYANKCNEIYDCSREEYEDMANANMRLNVENQELKSQLAGTTHCFDEEEHRKLKDEIKELEKIIELCHLDAKETLATINYEQESQQKEFIKYLEDEIKQINPKILDDGELNLRLDDIKYTQYLTYKEILQKYKSIIGDDK